MKIAIEKFWCVKYYKAQPYNMEHTLCVCVCGQGVRGQTVLSQNDDVKG